MAMPSLKRMFQILEGKIEKGIMIEAGEYNRKGSL